MGCSPLNPFRIPSVDVDTDISAQIGKDNNRQGIVGSTQDTKVSAEDNAVVDTTSTSSKGAAAISAKTIKKASSVNAKKVNTTSVKGEDIGVVKNAEKQTDVVIGDNATVTIIQNEGMPNWLVILLLCGPLVLTTIYVKREAIIGLFKRKS